MTDRVFREFLEHGLAAGLQLAAASDIVTVVPVGPPPAQRFIAEFRCRGIARHGEQIIPWHRFAVGIAFPDDHLRRAASAAMINLLAPEGCWHPNCRYPVICPGMMPAGSGLVDVLFQVYEILSFQRYSFSDPLNAEAARWARSHMHLFPTDPRPLRWRAERAADDDGSSRRSPSNTTRDAPPQPGPCTRPGGDPETPLPGEEATER